MFGAKEVTSTLGEALLEHASSERARGPVRIIVREPIEYRCSYCYPHCLLGKKVGRDITEKERDEAIRREDNLRDLYYHGWGIVFPPKWVSFPSNTVLSCITMYHDVYQHVSATYRLIHRYTPNTSLIHR